MIPFCPARWVFLWNKMICTSTVRPSACTPLSLINNIKLLTLLAPWRSFFMVRLYRVYKSLTVVLPVANKCWKISTVTFRCQIAIWCLYSIRLRYFEEAAVGSGVNACRLLCSQTAEPLPWWQRDPWSLSCLLIILMITTVQHGFWL